jgi:hypothetical protein
MHCAPAGSWLVPHATAANATNAEQRAMRIMATR